jgi:hypothetical protein
VRPWPNFRQHLAIKKATAVSGFFIIVSTACLEKPVVIDQQGGEQQGEVNDGIPKSAFR